MATQLAFIEQRGVIDIIAIVLTFLVCVKHWPRRNAAQYFCARNRAGHGAVPPVL
jgi:hypothetical protein